MSDKPDPKTLQSESPVTGSSVSSAKKPKSIKEWFLSLPAASQVALIGAVLGLIGVIAVPLINVMIKQPSSIPTPSLDSFIYSVRVQVKDTTNVIDGARVTIVVPGKAPIDVLSDATGIAMISVPGTHAGQLGQVLVEEAGYKRWDQFIELTPDQLPDVIELEPVP